MTQHESYFPSKYTQKTLQIVVPYYQTSQSGEQGASTQCLHAHEPQAKGWGWGLCYPKLLSTAQVLKICIFLQQAQSSVPQLIVKAEAQPGQSLSHYLRPSFFFSFCFLRTMSILRSFHMLLRSLMGRLPTYFPATKEQEMV